MKIDNYISELLYDHDCVIVTDLGGFIANYKPASINPALHVINPPSKNLAFNSSLKQNDGLLASHISQRSALNYAEASEVIREYVKQAQSNLKSGQKLKIEKVGVLYIDNKSNIQFLPDHHANYLISSFGLPALHSPLIKREVSVEAEEFSPKVIPIQRAVAKNKTVRKPFRWKVIEVIPAAAVLAFLFMVPPVLNEFNNNLSTLLPFSRMNEYINELKGEEVGYKPVTIEYKSPFDVPPPSIYLNKQMVKPQENVTAEPTPVSATPAEVHNSTIEAPVAEVAKDSKQETVSASVEIKDKSYFIIGGCFRLKENADKFIAEMKAKGNDAVIIGQNSAGLFMVSLYSSDNFIQTTDALPEIKSNAVDGAWILKK